MKKVVIICFLDGFANSIRPKEIKKYLESLGHKVTIVNTANLYKQEKKHLSLKVKIYLALLGIMARSMGGLSLLNRKLLNTFTRSLNAPILILQMKARGMYLSKYINACGFKVIICESSFDAYVVALPFNGITVYDSPSPWGYELYYNSAFTKNGFKQFQAFEKNIYEKADYLNFHWENYANFVKKNFYNGKNMFTMNYGVYQKPKSVHAQYNKPLKIIFLGYLSGYWVNLPLLSKLSKLYPIDVYGGPKPNKKWGLNYKGYAPSTDILKDYQLGLITITNDLLRRSSFSSKHLEYLSYGLPVLAPDWRNDNLLDTVTIKYNTNNFLDIIKHYEQKNVWEKMHTKSLEKAKEYKWGEILKPLKKIVQSEN